MENPWETPLAQWHIRAGMGPMYNFPYRRTWAHAQQADIRIAHQRECR